MSVHQELLTGSPDTAPTRREGLPTPSAGWTGTTVRVLFDFSLSGPEVVPVVKIMRAQGWFVACLYNQETDEAPQLYFAHMLKTGDAYALAQEIRRGLDRTQAD